MGKVLVEKLLRECPLINRMYLLVRKKKGVEPVQRREEYINHLVSFSRFLFLLVQFYCCAAMPDSVWGVFVACHLHIIKRFAF